MEILNKKQIAVISDIHGNVFALKKVLEDIKKREINTIVNLGDSLIGPVCPLETAKLLMSTDGIINIMGNGDEVLLNPNENFPSYNFTRPKLNEEILEWIRNFKFSAKIDNILFFHAKPSINTEYLVEKIENRRLVNKTPEELENEINNIEEKYLVCGHSHLDKVVMTKGGKVIANPGSVGLPAYSDEKPAPHNVENFSPFAKYMIMTKVENDMWNIENVKLVYEWNKASEIASKNNREDYAVPIKSGIVFE